MTQTNNPFFDDIAKLVTDAAGVAQGVKREVEAAVRARTESFLADMDLVRREDFEVVRDLAAAARAENDALRTRVDALEARIARLEAGKGADAMILLAGDGPDLTVG